MLKELTEADVDDCVALVAADWRWSKLIKNDATNNPRALVKWVFAACVDLLPDQRTLNDPLTVSDVKALEKTVQGRLGMAKNYKQLVGFIPIWIIALIINVIVQLIIHFFLDRTNNVIK